MEQTFIMIEPVGVQRGQENGRGEIVFLANETISRFRKNGFSLKGMRLTTVDRPVVAMIWEGENVVLTGRKIIGATNPSEYAPGTIRGDFAVEIGRNFIRGSGSVESTRKKIAQWFPDGSVDWDRGLLHLTSE